MVQMSRHSDKMVISSPATKMKGGNKIKYNEFIQNTTIKLNKYQELRYIPFDDKQKLECVPVRQGVSLSKLHLSNKLERDSSKHHLKLALVIVIF